MKFLIPVFIIFSFSFSVFGQERPRLGLTLSGGGAKGLAHLGILKAIDSSGLHIDYISGTSMGAVVGAMYAIGYNADTLLKISNKTDWDLLLSNSASLKNLSIDEKSEYDKYAIELPWENNGFRLPSGVLESEELWLRLSEYFFPVNALKNFSTFPRGFACMATDISSGEGVILDSGEIVQAIRASMTIPSVFTAVPFQGRKLVDGGIVNNFPVSVAKKEGADFVIGSNVAGSLLAKEKITNIFQVLLQVAFFREDKDAKEEKKMCDLYIQHHLDEYTMGSFGSVNEIIKEGCLVGDSIYPRLKKMSDSLNLIYGPDKRAYPKIPQMDSVKINAFEVHGLVKTNEVFFLHRIDMKPNTFYTAKEINNHIRKAFGTRYYKKIVYELHPLEDGSSKIIFDVEENPFTFAKSTISYNSFNGISLIGNITSRNFFTPYSRSLVSANIGENLRIRGEHLQYFGRFKTLTLSASIEASNIGFANYLNYVKDGTYKQSAVRADLNTHWTLNRNYAIGIGTSFQSYHYKPDIVSKFELRGYNNFLNTYAFVQFNTLSNAIYPKRGSTFNATVGYNYNQHHDIDFYHNGNLILNEDSLNGQFSDYWHVKADYQNFAPLSSKFTFITHLQMGISFHSKSIFYGDYFIGGLNASFPNQVLFAGLEEGTIRTNSAAMLQCGLRYRPYTNLYITARANMMALDFIKNSELTKSGSFLSGYAITLGYNFILGPLEISAMYCDQSKKLLPYINLGIPF
ncbi:MAG: patatin-like phospholipase family protein [Bacteroidetes bacterium]|nr:patatin-like phospholipase family protein [Bacteroidota bacterium]